MSKITALFASRRFGVFIIAVLTSLFRDVLGMDDATALSIAGLAGTWIIGDTVRRTE